MTATPARSETRVLERLLGRSVEIIHENQAASGGYLASPSLPVYRFSWLRDGAFIADAMSRAGEVTSAEAFFRWCSGIVSARTALVENLIRRSQAGGAVAYDEHLHCRYRVDGREGDMPWSNFQLDGYGAWLWALGEHARRHGRDLSELASGIELTARYVAAFWNTPCFDWWEERLGRHTATLAALYAGLTAASRFRFLPEDVRDEAARTAAAIEEAVLAEALVNGRLAAELGGERLDASLVACATPFRLLSPVDPLAVATVAALEAELAHGGVHRYAGDAYYGGGEWLLLAALLGWYYAEAGRHDDAWRELEWVSAHATTTGELPEQVGGHLLTPPGFDRWLGRFGPPATPLLWSHAMFLTLALELGVRSRSSSS